MSTELRVEASVEATTSAVGTGRYTAIPRSSSTRTLSTEGVSRLPSRPRSVRTFEAIPDELTAVTPNIASVAIGPNPQYECERGTRKTAEQQVEHADWRLPAHIRDQLVGGVLQAKHQQQEDDAHLGAGGEETLGSLQRQQACGAECQPSEQVERNGGETESPGQPAAGAQREQDGPSSAVGGQGVSRMDAVLGAHHDEAVAGLKTEVGGR
jgi:hypothetical protein